MSRINSEVLCDAFREEWMFQIEQAPSILTSPEYPEPGAWTSFMEKPGGVLEGTLKRLRRDNSGLHCRRQRYTLDSLFVGGQDLFRSDMNYPSEIHVAIEHEHGSHVEEEMWKLIHWRAPLKVLIFYDWNEWEKNSDSNRTWLGSKVSNLWSMLEQVNSYFPENVTTEYLFLIGYRGVPSRPPR